VELDPGLIVVDDAVVLADAVVPVLAFRPAIVYTRLAFVSDHSRGKR
jgi:hypothetical protein